MSELTVAVPPVQFNEHRDVETGLLTGVKHATLLSVPLATGHQPCRDIALTAFHSMLQRIAETSLPARGLALTPALVVRESCGAYLSRREPPPKPRREKTG